MGRLWRILNGAGLLFCSSDQLIDVIAKATQNLNGVAFFNAEQTDKLVFSTDIVTTQTFSFTLTFNG